MTGYHSKRSRSYRVLSIALGLVGGLAAGLLLMSPGAARADEAEAIEPEPLEWARIDYLRNRVQLLPVNDQARRARISDILGIGDSLRTLRRSRAELRFNDDSLARIGERATFRFTPNTRNFQLTNGTVLLLIPPERGRSTIQTPNAVTGIQGSALFVRYIPETDTTIVGALTDNPNGPMVLFNEDGSEQQALRANEIGVIQGDQITQIYRFDSLLFWQSSGLAEGFNYLEDTSSTGSDALDAVRQEIREAIAKQDPLPSDGEGIIENPESFSRPDQSDEPDSTDGEADSSDPTTTDESDLSGEDPSGEDPNGEGSSSEDPSGEDISGEGPSGEDVSGEDVSGESQTPPSDIQSNPDSPANSETETLPTTDGGNLGGNSNTPESVPDVPPSTESSTGNSALQLDLVDLNAPVVELEFEGTPAEAYLAVPSTNPLEVPDIGELNSLSPASPQGNTQQDAQGEGINIPSTALTPVEEASNTPKDPLQLSGSGGEDEVIPIVRPNPLTAPEDDPKVPENSGGISGAGSPSPSDNPSTPNSTDNPSDVPGNTTEPIDTAAPILPEDTLNPDTPEPLESVNAPANAPILDPSTSLVPIEPGTLIDSPASAGSSLNNVETVLPAEEESSLDNSVEGTEDNLQSIDSEITPELLESTPLEPEVGGSSLENVLDPLDGDGSPGVSAQPESTVNSGSSTSDTAGE